MENSKNSRNILGEFPAFLYKLGKKGEEKKKSDNGQRCFCIFVSKIATNLSRSVLITIASVEQ